MSVPDYNILDREEQVRLLASLQRMTASGSLTWEDPSKTSESFKRTDVFVGVVTKGPFGFILDSVDGDGEPPYELEVRRRDAKTQKLAPVAMVEMVPMDKGGDPEVNEMIRSLYQEALRRARRSDESVRELFDTLDDIEHDPPF